MNKANTLQLIEWLKQLVPGKGTYFDMGWYYRSNSCGTTCCMAGLIALRTSSPQEVVANAGYIRVAQEYLGLDSHQALALFEPNQTGEIFPWVSDPYEATPRKAINALKRAMEAWGAE